MEPGELDDKSIDYILGHIGIESLSEWENSFVESISDQWNLKRKLSDKQRDVLGKIWDKQP